MKDKIKVLIQTLEEKEQNLFNHYTNMDEKNADYFLFLGKCTATGEIREFIEELFNG